MNPCANVIVRVYDSEVAVASDPSASWGQRSAEAGERRQGGQGGQGGRRPTKHAKRQEVERLKPFLVWGNLSPDNGNDSQMPASPGHAAGVCSFTAFDVRIHCLQHHLFSRRDCVPRSPAHRSGTQASREWFCQARCRYALPRSGELGWGTFCCFSKSPGSLSQREMPFTGRGSTGPCPRRVRAANSGN